MSKVMSIMEKSIDFICAILVALLTIVVSAEVISRYFFGFPIIVTTELTSILFPWITAFAAITITLNEENIALTVVKDKFPPKIRYYLDIFIYLLSIGFTSIMIKSSIELSYQLRTQTMAILGYSKVILYGSMVIGFIMMTVVLLYRLFLRVVRKDGEAA